MGLETPEPGSGAFHRTPSVADQRSGRPFSPLTALRLGPRQPGQFSANVPSPPVARSVAAANNENSRSKGIRFRIKTALAAFTSVLSAAKQVTVQASLNDSPD